MSMPEHHKRQGLLGAKTVEVFSWNGRDIPGCSSKSRPGMMAWL